MALRGMAPRFRGQDDPRIQGALVATLGSGRHYTSALGAHSELLSTPRPEDGAGILVVFSTGQGARKVFAQKTRREGTA